MDHCRGQGVETAAAVGRTCMAHLVVVLVKGASVLCDLISVATLGLVCVRSPP